MKKWTTLIMGAALTVALAACGNNEAAEPSANAAEAPAAASTTATAAPEGSGAASTAEQAAGAPALEELIQKTAAAAAELKSFRMESQMQQNMVIKQGETSQEQAIDMKTTSEFIKDPLQMHQKIAMNLAGQGEQQIEQYITGDGVFTLTGGQWMKLPSGMTAQMTELMQQSASPETQLEQFKQIAGQTTITEEGDNYVLTADVSGDDVKSLAQNYLNQSGTADSQMTAMMENMNIKSMTISNSVNKETYLPVETNVNIVMDMTSGEQTVSMDMKMNAIISGYNEITEIKVPQEALDAQEAQMPATTQ
ncbi:DUF6612 family protein [Paenibacillus sp. MMS20-IR301]|uniref:DUF6612 family protein n=1 Tax=Paenibacillus sp. MMS20-IR301 TaxID=2895946 RepID=UPI0028E50E18|nr:DUF6612 family protein [Paenibacillus sp. MMS20-IR301]WNS41356.1 hypothetical protein LOS79_20235 [Paenibacillus sp. MMS20-IR301]